VPEKSNIWRDCVDGYYDWVKEHIMEGAPLNEADHCGDPPLLLAAGNGHKAVCELLLEEGADIEQRNVMGESPLIRAAHNGHFHTVKFLVENKADVNAIDMGDNTALHWAAMRGHVEIVKFLMDQGADKTLRNKQDKMAIDLCQPCWSDSYRYAMIRDDSSPMAWCGVAWRGVVGVLFSIVLSIVLYCIVIGGPTNVWNAPTDVLHSMPRHCSRVVDETRTAGLPGRSWREEEREHAECLSRERVVYPPVGR
jgi:hypothetical protein